MFMVIIFNKQWIKYFLDIKKVIFNFFPHNFTNSAFNHNIREFACIYMLFT